MKSRYPYLFAGLAFLGLAFCNAVGAPLRVLFFSKSSGWEHSAIKEDNFKPSYAQTVLTKLGEKNGIEFTFTKDGSLFSDSYLAQFNVVVFYTSGDLCSTGTDRYPGITSSGLAAFYHYVSNGGGFLGLHSASDTLHTNERGGGNPAIRAPRYKNYGEAADPYVKMIGGEFIRHGPQQVAKATVTDPKFPGFGTIGSELNVNEEWYTLKEFAPDIHVLLVMQTAGMKGDDYKRAPYPLAWVHAYGKGRVAFNAMGHREDVWDSEAYQSMLLGQLKWAAGEATADIAPNLKEVAPEAMTIQPVPADVR
ncbi:MAG TPA: ThuA domain-containing protein [Candidatus Didemnitutus sp.]|nr:ThuA domain-containing protein [Candidatus Didemnitutus sp.]